MDYNANDRDQVRRAYLQKGPCQPCDHNFPQKSFGQKLQQFNQAWFSEFPNWLEYSVAKDATFCLCCYLFKPDIRDQAGGDSFVARIGYQTRLNASVDCVKFLLRQGLAFRGHDVSENSSNQGNFLELLKFLADHNEYVKVVALSNAPQNLKLTSPGIQKYIVNVATFETVNVIIKDLGDALFSILIDEARDISIKEQMTVTWIEYFLIAGQGYDGASNMQAVAKNHNQISLPFTLVSIVVNAIGASCKRRDIVREKQAVKVDETLNIRELSSGQDLNQETNLKRACDTRWGSHYGTLVSLASMFSTVIDVLDMILKDGSNSEQRVEANILLDSIQSFEFVFNLHLMKMILAITMELMVLNDQFDTYIIDMLSSSEFSMLNEIANLAKKMMKIRRDKLYLLVYLLLTLVLILPVATVTVEKVFSAMNIVKNRLRNRMGDEWMNDSLVVYIGRDIFDGIDNDTIMERFQKMKTRRVNYALQQEFLEDSDSDDSSAPEDIPVVSADRPLRLEPMVEDLPIEQPNETVVPTEGILATESELPLETGLQVGGDAAFDTEIEELFS
ncbi:uncharacterized protein LOC114323236 [Camellia sinensis]|uniref:uncharacterized protein LOC114323236 n=1 Tax=Camellia sinensis TaxID=4442 RepID=UPI0010363774|nr:uncharacterized protein LOC114323236 [Camellia sinensis]